VLLLRTSCKLDAYISSKSTPSGVDFFLSCDIIDLQA